ncbi:MAG: Unknown protein [uncultured Sulfurovum sp.]|uniref:Uncharacterized protein n=1 Tax=uncultured Sulfurovum sp. TaxID=269237 RepID=A0A6S6SAG4_9BACT|nr:MAG: Unknown protein [uncultured Sulfurovum sp.]
MKKILVIYLLLTSTLIFAENYNCRDYREINISKENDKEYIIDREKDLFYKKKTLQLDDKKVVIEHYDYEGIFNKNDGFFIKVFDIDDTLIMQENIDKDIYKFQAIKRGEEIILVLNLVNGEGSTLEIISFNEELKFRKIYERIGRDGSFDKHDSFSLGDIILNQENEIIMAFQLSIYYSAKFTRNYGDFVFFLKFDQNNRLVWERKLEVPYGTRYEESDNNLTYIENNYLHRPLLYNQLTILDEMSGCYLIYNDIANLYKYYAIDNDGYLWTKDPNATQKVEDFLYPQREEMSKEDWISFVGFLLFLVAYFIYRKVKNK